MNLTRSTLTWRRLRLFIAAWTSSKSYIKVCWFSRIQLNWWLTWSRIFWISLKLDLANSEKALLGSTFERPLKKLWASKESKPSKRNSTSRSISPTLRRRQAIGVKKLKGSPAEWGRTRWVQSFVVTSIESCKSYWDYSQMHSNSQRRVESRLMSL